MADAKITDLTEETAPAASDLLVMVDDPAGTPVTKKIQITTALDTDGALLKRIILGSNFVINSGAANLLTDITGLSFSVTSGKPYYFRFFGMFTTGASTTGSRWTINGPTMTQLAYKSEYSLTSTTVTTNAQLTAIQLPASSNATSNVSNGGGNFVEVQGMLLPSATGTLQIQGAREVTTDSVTLLAGSFLEYKQLIA